MNATGKSPLSSHSPVGRALTLSLLLVLVLGFTARVASAQSGRNASWWVVLDVVIDSKFDQYLDARKEIVALLHKDRISSSQFAVVAMQTDEAACVAYSSPTVEGTTTTTNGYSDPAEAFPDWEALFGGLGPDYVDAWHRMRDATRTTSQYLIRYRPDLSYTPGNERLTAEEQGYLRAQQYFMPPSSQTAFEEVLADRKALYRENALENGFRVFEVVVGPEVPGFMVAYGGRTKADLDAALANDRLILGAAGEALENRARLLASKILTHPQRLRLDLSYFPQ